MQPKGKNRRRTSTSSKCWPKAVFVFSVFSMFLCIGSWVTLEFVSLATEHISQENKDVNTHEKSQDCGKVQDNEVLLSTDLDPSFGPGQSESSILMSSNISAHLHMKYFNDYKNAQKPYFPNGSVPLKFNSSLPTDYIKGLDLINNNIVVLSKGNYFVYSSIHILVLGSLPCRQHPQKIWKHMVKLTRAGEKATQDLLLAQHTCCDHCTRDRSTSYTAGVFQLNSNDSLRVEINGHGLVSCDYETNCFFGLVKLDGCI
ncbi:hypothetical protein Btru_023598 [Bulinus truncatus]|nr:hypothetical protein Btru_023598 [Bulinus truncatus]